MATVLNPLDKTRGRWRKPSDLVLSVLMIVRPLPDICSYRPPCYSPPQGVPAEVYVEVGADWTAHGPANRATVGEFIAQMILKNK